MRVERLQQPVYAVAISILGGGTGLAVADGVTVIPLLCIAI